MISLAILFKRLYLSLIYFYVQAQDKKTWKQERQKMQKYRQWNRRNYILYYIYMYIYLYLYILYFLFFILCSYSLRFIFGSELGGYKIEFFAVVRIVDNLNKES